MKIVFMGTPDFAAGVLETIIEEGYEVSLVVTQADKPQGRSGKLVYPAVKEVALKHNLPIFQPEKLKTEESVKILQSYEADLYVVVAYGKMLSQKILDFPKLGCINIHASLLPKYRGAAPIQWAVINGDKKTGVTIQKMELGMDTGDILFTKEFQLDPKETGESLFDRLCEVSKSLIKEALPKIEQGDVTPIKQDESQASYAPMLSKEMGNLDFTKSAKELEQLVRGLNSWPCAYTYFQGKTLKIWESDVCEEDATDKPATVAKVTKDAIYVNTAQGQLILRSVQLEGKKRMNVHDFLLGNHVKTGDMFTRGK